MRIYRLLLGTVFGLLAACSDSGDASKAMPSRAALNGANAGANLSFEKSFVVVDQKSLSAIEKDFSMGGLLYALNEYLASITQQWNADHPDDQKPLHDDAAFALNPFKVASQDVQGNNAASNHVGSVWPTIDTVGERILPTFDPQKDPVGPFRLLAVIDRLDLAGDFDMRSGGVLAGVERRWFGEGRLVFGLRDAFDAKTPFPMTFIMEFRLPALKRNANGDIVVDKSFDFAKGPASMDDWIARRQLWATVWKNLSSYDLGSSGYVDALRSTVALFATGKNHLALRTGEQVRAQKNGSITNEFEYREFYLDDNWLLATRKLRREPFACSEKSILGNRIGDEWNDVEKQMDWNYMLGERNLSDKEISDATAGCGGQLPYGQDNHGDTVQLRAKFARFKPQTVWTPAIPEERRHAFALGTCTGCHARETGTTGFQVAPSLPGKNAVLSAFLSGTTAATPNGTPYAYDEPTRRMQLLKQFLNGVDVPGDMLHDLACNDADTCTVE